MTKLESELEQFVFINDEVNIFSAKQLCNILILPRQYRTISLFYTANDLEKDIAQNGRSTLMEKIIAKSKAGNCNCAINNPKGY